MTIELKEVASNCNPNDSSGNYTQQLSILTEARFDKTPVQCSAVDITSSSNFDTIFFSRYAVLSVLGE